MDYPFRCAECKKEEIVQMNMKDYTSEGHKCSYCGSPLERIITGTMSIDKTGTFFRKIN